MPNQEVDTVNILAIVGSLRRESFNRKVMVAAQRLAPEGINITIGDISDVPIYNDDVYQQGFPQSVSRLREAVLSSDAVLIATPEYNHSVPGVLKNALDWISRPPDQPFKTKPVGIIGASPGRLGTVRAQAHLIQILQGMSALVVNDPKVFLSGAMHLFDDDGTINNEKTAEFISRLLISLKQWTLQLQQS